MGGSFLEIATDAEMLRSPIGCRRTAVWGLKPTGLREVPGTLKQERFYCTHATQLPPEVLCSVVEGNS